MFLVQYFFLRFDSSSCSCFSCCRSCWSWRSSCHRYANWSPRSNASGSDDGAAWSTSTIAFVSIRRFHSTWAMTTTKVAHIIGTAGFRSIKISRQSFRFVKGPRSRTCRHPLWRVELSPSEVKVGHGGGVRRVCRLKLDDWKLESVDICVRKFAVIVEAVCQVSDSCCGGSWRAFQNCDQLPFSWMDMMRLVTSLLKDKMS